LRGGRSRCFTGQLPMLLSRCHSPSSSLCVASIPTPAAQTLTLAGLGSHFETLSLLFHPTANHRRETHNNGHTSQVQRWRRGAALEAVGRRALLRRRRSSQVRSQLFNDTRTGIRVPCPRVSGVSWGVRGCPGVSCGIRAAGRPGCPGAPRTPQDLAPDSCLREPPDTPRPSGQRISSQIRTAAVPALSEKHTKRL